MDNSDEVTGARRDGGVAGSAEAVVEGVVLPRPLPQGGEKEEQRATGSDIARLPAPGQEIVEPFRHRHDGWTPIRQRAFLRALAETGCVRQACARVRLSSTSAYRVRRRVPEFARLWDQALSMIAPILEHAAYERGVEGWEEPVWYAGKIVGQRRRYSDAMLRLLLQRGFHPGQAQTEETPEQLVAAAKEAARRAGGYFITKVTAEETDAVLRRKLDALARRLKAQVVSPATNGPADSSWCSSP